MLLETQAALTALLQQPEVLRAHVPALARKVAEGICQVPGVVVLGDTDGMMVFYPEGNRHYDSHYLFPPWTRGQDLKQRAVRMLHTMFGPVGATVIGGETPVGNMGARVMNRSLGCEVAGHVINPESGPSIRYVLTKERFLQKFPDTTQYVDT